MNQLDRELLRVWVDAKLAIAEQNDPADELFVDEAIGNDWFAVAVKFRELCAKDETIEHLETSDEPLPCPRCGGDTDPTWFCSENFCPECCESTDYHSEDT